MAISAGVGSDGCSLLLPYFIRKTRRLGGPGEALSGSILWWVFHSTLDPLYRQLCSFSAAAFVPGEEEHSRLLLEQGQCPGEGMP